MRKITICAFFICAFAISVNAEVLTTNPSFETADAASPTGADDWVGNKGITIRSTDKAHTGTASISVVVPADNTTLNDIQLKNMEADNMTRVELTEKIKLSFWLYLPEAGSAKLLSIQPFATQAGIFPGATFTADITKDEWMHIESAEFTLEEKGKPNAMKIGTGVKALFDKAVTDALTFYVDDVELIKVDATSVASPDAAERLFVATEKDGLRIIGATKGELVEVFNVSGVRIAAETIVSDQQFISAQSGVYIVKMGNQVKKVML